MGNHQTVLVAISATERDPLTVARPQRSAGGLVAAEADTLLRAQIHHPELAIGAAGAIAHHDRISDVAAIGREHRTSDGAQARKIATGDDLGAGGRGDG